MEKEEGETLMDRRNTLAAPMNRPNSMVDLRKEVLTEGSPLNRRETVMPFKSPDTIVEESEDDLIGDQVDKMAMSIKE